MIEEIMQPGQQQAPLTQAEVEKAAEEDFRNNLKDVVMIVRRLAPMCKTVHELTELCENAIAYDAVLRMVLKEVVPVQMKK